MLKRLIAAITLGAALCISSLAYAACGVCESVQCCLGCSPTGAQIKNFLGVNTVLFQDDVHYCYKCTPTGDGSANLVFVWADMDPMSTRVFPERQAPVYIKASIQKQCDGTIVSTLEQ
ncbi:MAG: hypothetical protein A3I12_03095 [Gammaproteobacteria bacterium RIFCSPLOWO2_02_FULL_38_11]|nr:MAG: hypothetical protein A3B69_00760 [Gammaproteobacteria bacterium RIFCSPHIGHO2_02_FULL_38_33]OGT69598.1 MAG: hypothetical protein A3I12_03095 [Gammaproteobacteria bacterium RIFCSPLOWO2_02_FULL_38_11]